MLPSRYLLPIIAVLLCIAPPLPAADEAAPADVSLDEYIARLGAESRMERLGAARAIVEMGAKAEAAVPALVESLQDEDEAVRMVAAVGLALVGPGAPEAAPALTQALQDRDARVREFAAAGIGALGPASEGAAEALQRALSDPDERVRREAGLSIEYMQGIGSRPKGFDIESARRTPDRPTADRPIAQRPEGEPLPAEAPPGQTSPAGPPRRGGAGGGASSVPPSATGTQPGLVAARRSVLQLVQQLRDPDPARRLAAADALGKMGPSAKDAVPALEQARTDPDEQVRRKAFWALNQINRPADTPKPEPEVVEEKPGEGRVFYYIACHEVDENGITPRKDLTRGINNSKAYLFGFFTEMHYLDVGQVWRYRKDAQQRGLKADAPLFDLLKSDPQGDNIGSKFPLIDSYKKDYVISVTCNGQTRFMHKRWDSTGKLHEWGGGQHINMQNGPYTAEINLFSSEGFRLQFSIDFTFESEIDEEDLESVKKITGPGSVAVEDRQMLAQVNPRNKNDGKYRATSAQDVSEALATAAWSLMAYSGARASDVMPYILEGVALQKQSKQLDPETSLHTDGMFSLIAECLAQNTPQGYALGLELTGLLEASVSRYPPNHEDGYVRKGWMHRAGSHSILADAAITYRNDVNLFRAHAEQELRLDGQIWLPNSSRPLKPIDAAKERDTWPQPGWWRSEWDTLRPPELGTLGTQDDDQEPAREPPPSRARQILAKLKEALEELDEQRAQDVRWINGIRKSLLAAERRKAEVRSLLRVGALMAQRIRGRMAHLRKVLADIPETEGRTYLEDAFKLGIDTWDSAWGPPPQSNAEARTFLRQQVAELGKQSEEILREQDAIIEDTIETYYEGIILEIEAKGDQSLWEDIRKVSKVAKQDVQETLALAKAELWLASGQGKKFRVAAREAIADGKYEAQVRFMEAMHFHSTKDYAHALHSYRRVLELGELMGEPFPAMTEEEARKLDPQQADVYERARQMVWILEHGYLNAIDEKAAGEAAAVRAKSAERLEKGGAKGWLGWLIGYVKMGPFSAASAWVGREDALENLASQFQQNVGAQHGGLLLIKSLHEQGVPLNQIDGLTNDEFIQLMTEKFPEHQSPITSEHALRLRAAVKAAFANSDVKHLATSPKLMLDADTGKPYLDSRQYDETAMEWWGDIFNIWNLGTMLGPMTTFRISGKVAKVHTFWGATWQSVSKGGASVMTAKEAFAGAVGLPKLATVLGKTKTGQLMVKQFSKFFSKSTWLKDRALDATIQLVAAKTGEAAGGTIGVLMGSDGKVEAEAGQMLGQLFTAWGAGDVDVMKKIMVANRIKPLHLKALIAQAEQIAETSAETATVVGRHIKVLQEALPEVDGGGLTAGTRRAVRQSINEIKGRLAEATRKLQAGEGTPELCRQVDGLKMAYEGLASAEAGMLGQARTWQDIIQEAADGGNAEAQAMMRQSQSLRQVASQLDDAPQPVLRKTPAGPLGPTAGQPKDALIFGNGDRLTRDLDKLALDGDLGRAVSGYERRLALLKQIGAGDTPEAQQLAMRARELREIWGAEHRLRLADDPLDMGHTNEILPGEIEAMDANPNIVKVRMAQSDADATYSDPHWVWKMESDRAVKVGVFKGSGPDFPDHYDLRAEVLYYKLAKLIGVDVPACKVGTMTINGKQVKGLFVRIASGTRLEYFDNGTHIAVKELLARDKVLAAVMADHDRRMANYLLAGKDQLRSIDHGMADPCGRQLGEASEWADDELVQYGIRTRILGEGRNHQHLEYLDQHITMEDMLPAIRQMETLFGDKAEVHNIAEVRKIAEIRKMVESVYLDPRNYPAGYDATRFQVEVDAAMKTLYGRVRNLESSLGKFYGSSELLGDPPTPGTAWRRNGGEPVSDLPPEAIPALPLAA